MTNDDPLKVRTEILQQVAALQLESTFLHLRLAANKQPGGGCGSAAQQAACTQ